MKNDKIRYALEIKTMYKLMKIYTNNISIDQYPSSDLKDNKIKFRILHDNKEESNFEIISSMVRYPECYEGSLEKLEIGDYPYLGVLDTWLSNNIVLLSAEQKLGFYDINNLETVWLMSDVNYVNYK